MQKINNARVHADRKEILPDHNASNTGLQYSHVLKHLPISEQEQAVTSLLCILCCWCSPDLGQQLKSSSDISFFLAGFHFLLTDLWLLAVIVFTLSGSQITTSASDPTAIRPFLGYRLKILAALVLVTATNWLSSILPVAYKTMWFEQNTLLKWGFTIQSTERSGRYWKASLYRYGDVAWSRYCITQDFIYSSLLGSFK